MTTTFKSCLQATADAAYVAHGEAAIGAKLALGTPGATVMVEGTRVAAGSGWGDGKTFEVIATGAEAWLVAQGSPAAIATKLNELIRSFMQLKSDYDNGIFPTTANDVEEIL
jgi:hypothetical protein